MSVATGASGSPTTGERVLAGSERVLSSILLLDFLIGFALLWDRHPLPGVGQPAGIVVMVGAIVLGAFRRPRYRLRHQGDILAVYALMLIWAIAVSQVGLLDWRQRSLKLVILLLFALTIAVGRLHVPSVLVGYLTGSLLNIPLFYLGLTPNNYPPHLTGFMGDKNVSGFVYALCVIVCMLVVKGRSRWVIMGLLAGALFLTGSRTSMAGAVAGLIWLLLRNRISYLARWGLAGLLAFLLWFVEERFARGGVFADRDGTDWFRAQIEAATSRKLAQSPWYGDGLTTAWVELSDTRTIWFHNSYAALRIEGGWPMVAAMAVLVVFLALGAHVVDAVSHSLAIVEGAVVVVLVCAWKLGEVFFTTPAMLVMGMAWSLRYGAPTTPENEAKYSGEDEQEPRSTPLALGRDIP